MGGVRTWALFLALAVPACTVQAETASLELDARSLDALLQARVGEQTPILLDWHGSADGVPDAAGAKTSSLELAASLRRIEVYAPDARVLEATADGYRELPRDPRLHFVAIGSAGQRFGLSLAADGSTAEGILLREGRMFALTGQAAADGGLQLNALDVDAPLADGSRLESSCSGDMGAASDVAAKAQAVDMRSLRPRSQALMGAIAERSRQAGPGLAKAATRQVTVAVDTDNEFLQKKFSNNTSNATQYVAALFTALNAIYEDDPAQYGLQLRLVQGTVILRPSTTADPYSNSDSSATGAALNEFGAWWRDNQASVPRAFAMQLSGKAASGNSASGIAWLVSSGTYCTAKGSSGSSVFGHYSVNRVFWNPNLQAANDAYLVGHELGHNLGARHTHCASASNGSQASTGTIDRCWAGEAGQGCYSGPQTCPTGGESPTAPQGSLMSYCHLNGLGCGVSTEIHPTHVNQLTARLDSQPSSCVSVIGTGNQAPVLNLPASFSTNEDTPLSLTGISVSDPEGAPLTLSISLPANSGTLAASSANGVSVGGTATARTLSGSAANLNAFISGSRLSYSPAANASGTVNLGFSLSDGSNAVQREVNLNIAAINDAPTLTAPGIFSVTEDQASALQQITVADVDAGSGELELRLQAASGSFGGNSALGVTASGTGTNRTLRGTASDLTGYIANGRLTFRAASNFNGTVALSLVLDDRGNTPGPARQAQASASLQVAAVNDAPTIQTPSSLLANAGQVRALSGIVYADADAPLGDIEVRASFTAPAGRFLADNRPGVSITGAGASLQLTGRLADLNAYLAAGALRLEVPASAAGVLVLQLGIDDLGNTGSGGPRSGAANLSLLIEAAEPGRMFADGFEP